MNRRTFFRVTLLFACLSVSCLTNIQAQEGKVPKSEEDSQLTIGKQYVIEVETGDESSTLHYQGRLKKMGTQQLVLTNVVKTATQEQGVPLLRDIPYVARLFKNVGIGSEKVDHDVTIKRKTIIRVIASSKAIASPRTEVR